MKVFNALILDEVMQDGPGGSVVLYSDPRFNEVLAAVDQVAFAVKVSYTDTGGGADGLLSIFLEESPDGIDWQTRTTGRTSITLGPGAPVYRRFHDAGTEPRLCHLRLRLSWFSNEEGAATVRVWATGRTLGAKAGALENGGC